MQAAKEKKRLRLSAQTIAMLVITVLMVIINILSWLSAGLTDFYAENIFSPAASVLSALTGAAPFSVGEVMIIIGIILLAAAPILFITAAVRRKKRSLKVLGRIYCWVLIYIFAMETLNCFVLYHTTEFSDRYLCGGDGMYDVSLLTELTENIITDANAHAELVARDEDGKMVVPDDIGELAEISMNSISADYPQLAGKYPQPKKISFSLLMTQLDLQGIYFPFSLEANYNAELSPARVPCTVMHELSHVKGFIREDEACFIAYCACIASDSAEVRYSGLLSAVNYLMAEVKKNASPEEMVRLTQLMSPQVISDNTFVSREFKEKVEQEAIIPTETVSAVSEKAMETTLKINGVADGKKSYGRMVRLLMDYYYGDTFSAEE